jgi:hypothetical protein
MSRSLAGELIRMMYNTKLHVVEVRRRPNSFSLARMRSGVMLTSHRWRYQDDTYVGAPHLNFFSGDTGFETRWDNRDSFSCFRSFFRRCSRRL